MEVERNGYIKNIKLTPKEVEVDGEKYIAMDFKSMMKLNMAFFQL